jgi:recombination protein RecA
MVMTRRKTAGRRNDGRPEVLRKALASIEKQFGKGTVMSLGDDGVREGGIPVIPTGSPSLDAALGTGGYPRGRVTEIFGPESSGKTTLALHAIAQAQSGGGVAAFIDAEHAFDVTYASAIGVNVKELLVSQPDCGEQALEVAEILIRSGVVDLVVIDSVAALTPRAEIEGEMGDAHLGLHARLMSQALRKLTGVIHRNSACLVFINQIRHKIGVMFGSPETTTGGNALKFYASVRLDIRRTGAIKSGESILGSKTRVKVVKNKVAPPFREAHFEIRYGRGINVEAELLDAALEVGLVQRSGTWYSTDGERLAQGRQATLELLATRPELIQTLRSRLGGQEAPTSRDAEPDPAAA